MIINEEDGEHDDSMDDEIFENNDENLNSVDEADEAG